MVAEEYLGRSWLLRRLRNGPHGQLIELYSSRLVKDGLARQGTWRSLNVVSGLLRWLPRAHLALAGLDEHILDRYLLKAREILIAAELLQQFPTTAALIIDQLDAVASERARGQRGDADVIRTRLLCAARPWLRYLRWPG